MRNHIKIKESDVLEFSWNPFFNGPSSLPDFIICRLVKRDDEGLYISMSFRQGNYRMSVEELLDIYEHYDCEVIPLVKIKDIVQLTLFM